MWWYVVHALAHTMQGQSTLSKKKNEPHAKTKAHGNKKKTSSRAKCKVDALKLNAAYQTIVEAPQFDQEDNMSETFITDLDYKSS